MKGLRISILPLVTEKSMQVSKGGKYTFKVPLMAEKNEIKKEIEKTFNVKISSISTQIVKGGTKTLRNREQIKLKDFKKAIVSLSSGKIEIFEKA